MSIRAHPKQHLHEHKNKWIIDYYPQGRKGKQVRIVYKGKEGDARKWEAELRRQGGPPTASIVNPKIIDVVPEYLEWLRIHRAKNTCEDVKRSLKHLMPLFGRLQVSRLTPLIISEYKKRREGRPRSTNKELAYLRGIIAYMVRNNYCNPINFRFGEVPYEPPLPQVPHPEEFGKFLAQITNPVKRAMVLLKWTAGLRWKEASRIRWEYIDFPGGIIYLRETKGSKPRLCILAKEVRDILEPMRKETGYVFVNPRTGEPFKSIYTLFRLACKRAGIRRLNPHLLRHAFCTYTLEATGDLRVVQEMAGHKDISTTTLYTHIATNRMKDAMTMTHAYIMKLQNQQTGGNKGGIRVQNKTLDHLV